MRYIVESHATKFPAGILDGWSQGWSHRELRKQGTRIGVARKERADENFVIPNAVSGTED